MVDKKTIGITSLITLGIILVSLVGPGFFDNNNFYCESESSIIECPGGLSGGLGTRCYLNTEKNSWDYCSSGWAEIINDTQIQEEPNIPSQGIGVWGEQYNCDQEKCVKV